MLCAIRAAERGIKVVILDENRQLGRKLRITGKGRCNLTNNCDADTFFSSVMSNSKFLYSSFSSFDSQDTMEFFEEAGLELKTERALR